MYIFAMMYPAHEVLNEKPKRKKGFDVTNGKQTTRNSERTWVWGSSSWRTPTFTNFSVGDFSDFFYPTIPVPISWLVLVESVKFAAWLLSDHPKNSCSTSPQLSWKKVRQSPFSPHHNDLHTFCNSPSHVGHSLKPSPTTSRFKASPKTWLPQWSRRNPKRTGLHKKSKWIHGSRAEKERKSWTNDKVEKGQWMTNWVVAILHQVSGG